MTQRKGTYVSYTVITHKLTLGMMGKSTITLFYTH